MDFKTSRLGTCKHIEAISLANEGEYVRKVYLLPFHTYVYVDYPDGRKIKIRQGQGISREMKDHIQTLFDGMGEIRNMQFDPSDFIRKAKLIDETFEWEPNTNGFRRSEDLPIPLPSWWKEASSSARSN